MNTTQFHREFEALYPNEAYAIPDELLFSPFVAQKEDLCPDVQGMLSLRKQRLLNLAYRLLPPGEAYLEVGTYHGKSLLSAMLNNPLRPTHAVDNFSEFEGNSLAVLQKNLANYGLADKVTFHDADFRTIYTPENLPQPVGLYFFDGPHDEQSQYDGIHLIEPYLASDALVLVDDWRLRRRLRLLRQGGHPPRHHRLPPPLEASLRAPRPLQRRPRPLVERRRRPQLQPHRLNAWDKNSTG
jgi:predicted O-methyltransferase YrrM